MGEAPQTAWQMCNKKLITAALKLFQVCFFCRIIHFVSTFSASYPPSTSKKPHNYAIFSNLAEFVNIFQLILLKKYHQFILNAFSRVFFL